uniref:Uncharacterized protein n=1 Tax=Glossina brevipalpis TaxID=37001 RepID=A0A1A9W7V1_9MUSC
MNIERQSKDYLTPQMSIESIFKPFLEFRFELFHPEFQHKYFSILLYSFYQMLEKLKPMFKSVESAIRTPLPKHGISSLFFVIICFVHTVYVVEVVSLIRLQKLNAASVMGVSCQLPREYFFSSKSTYQNMYQTFPNTSQHNFTGYGSRLQWIASTESNSLYFLENRAGTAFTTIRIGLHCCNQEYKYNDSGVRSAYCNRF